MGVAALGTVLAAGYLLWLLQRSAFGNPPDEFANDPIIVDTTRTEWIAWAPMLALILAIGIYPNLVFGSTDDAVDASLTPCLTAKAPLDHNLAETLACSEVYDLGGQGHHSHDHAATGG